MKEQRSVASALPRVSMGPLVDSGSESFIFGLR